MKGAAWSVPAIDPVSTAPVFAALGCGSLSLSGAERPSPADAKAGYRNGHVIPLSAENTGDGQATITVVPSNPGGAKLPSPHVLNLNTCVKSRSSLQVPAHASFSNPALTATNPTDTGERWSSPVPRHSITRNSR